MTENSFYEKIKARLSQEGLDIELIDKLYYIGGCEYSQSALSEMKTSVDSSSLNDFFDKNPYNVLQDNIELYGVILKDEESVLLVWFDPYELFGREGFIDKIAAKSGQLLKLEIAELIYSA